MIFFYKIDTAMSLSEYESNLAIDTHASVQHHVMRVLETHPVNCRPPQDGASVASPAMGHWGTTLNDIILVHFLINLRANYPSIM